KLPPIFPRIYLKKEIAEIGKLVAAAKREETKMTEEKEERKAEIAIDDFSKIDLRVALVTACEKVETTDKLLKLTVKLGEEMRTVVSGIAKFYTPEEMVGKRVVMIANLKPAKLRGIESRGMILCAEDAEGNLSLVSPEKAGFADGSGIF
ncbi:MAG: methionine--tRNA ligase subunit beta, partial [Clostridia bacterium]|nr:methionine--tRNA ligase subunit beta [Clostridia bacterium]